MAQPALPAWPAPPTGQWPLPLPFPRAALPLGPLPHPVLPHPSTLSRPCTRPPPPHLRPLSGSCTPRTEPQPGLRAAWPDSSPDASAVPSCMSLAGHQPLAPLLIKWGTLAAPLWLGICSPPRQQVFGAFLCGTRAGRPKLRCVRSAGRRSTNTHKETPGEPGGWCCSREQWLDRLGQGPRVAVPAAQSAVLAAQMSRGSCSRARGWGEHTGHRPRT